MLCLLAQSKNERRTKLQAWPKNGIDLTTYILFHYIFRRTFIISPIAAVMCRTVWTCSSKNTIQCRQLCAPSKEKVVKIIRPRSIRIKCSIMRWVAFDGGTENRPPNERMLIYGTHEPEISNLLGFLAWRLPRRRKKGEEATEKVEDIWFIEEMGRK